MDITPKIGVSLAHIPLGSLRSAWKHSFPQISRLDNRPSFNLRRLSSVASCVVSTSTVASTACGSFLARSLMVLLSAFELAWSLSRTTLGCPSTASPLSIRIPYFASFFWVRAGYTLPPAPKTVVLKEQGLKTGNDMDCVGDISSIHLAKNWFDGECKNKIAQQRNTLIFFVRGTAFKLLV